MVAESFTTNSFCLPGAGGHSKTQFRICINGSAIRITKPILVKLRTNKRPHCAFYENVKGSSTQLINVARFFIV
jgi:hypothetical protein